MRVDDFDYPLPEELIALRPASPRDAARLLVIEPGASPPFTDRMIRDLPKLLCPGDALATRYTAPPITKMAPTPSAKSPPRTMSTITSGDRPDFGRCGGGGG